MIFQFIKPTFFLISLSLFFLVTISCGNQKNERKQTETGRFNINELTEFAIKEIRNFSESHQNEIFYGFAIDANLLCLNSIEAFDKTLKEYQETSEKYNESEKIRQIKNNTGNWEYQGFSEFNDSSGFNRASYLDHYHLSDEEQLSTDYAKAMDQVIRRLKKSNAFENLKKTEDFYIIRVEHNY